MEPALSIVRRRDTPGYSSLGNYGEMLDHVNCWMEGTRREGEGRKFRPNEIASSVSHPISPYSWLIYHAKTLARRDINVDTAG